MTLNRAHGSQSMPKWARVASGSYPYKSREGRMLAVAIDAEVDGRGQLLAVLQVHGLLIKDRLAELTKDKKGGR